MSTTKSVKIQKNKVLTYSINKPGFKTVYGSRLVAIDQSININLKNINSQDEPFQLGDRLFGISSFVDYFTPSGNYDVDSLKYLSIEQTVGTGLVVQIVKDTWLSQVETTLGIETPKGSSNTFIFTYDGSNWQLTGATIQSNVDLEEYGISFEGTATSGDVITVVETQYNKFAFFVLDANYRSNQKWYATASHVVPVGYLSNPQNCLESSTYFNTYIKDNLNINNYPLFNVCKNLGDFLLSNGIKINALVPQMKEIQMIYNNRTILDTFDPNTMINPSVEFNLSTWAFALQSPTSVEYRRVWSCQQTDASVCWFFRNGGTIQADGSFNGFSLGCLPIFEVPVM